MSGSDNGGTISVADIPTTTVASGMWRTSTVTRHKQNILKTLFWPVAKDANYASVSMLCHFDDTVGRSGTAGTFLLCNTPSALLANSFQIFVITSPATCTSGLSTTQAKFGTKSFFLGSAGIPRSVPVGTEYTFGSGDWTMEFFFWYSTQNILQLLMDFRNSNASELVPTTYINSSNKLIYFTNGVDRITGTTTLTTSVWHHVVVSKVSGSTFMGLDGAQEGSTYTDGNTYTTPTNLRLGVSGGGTSPLLSGYFDEVRVTKGVGRYSGGAYTVPKVPFPDY